MPDPTASDPADAVPLDDAEVDRVLVVTAHPDDVDFACAGSVATWTDAGIEVTYCVCTDGQAGGFDAGVDRAQIPVIRRAEQTAAASEVGVTDLRFLGYVDGELEVSADLVRDLCRVIRQVRPQRLVVQSPERRWDRIGAGHPDHLATGEAATRAVYPFSRNPYAFPQLLGDEGLEPWTVREMWLWLHERATHAIDVTDVFDRKMRALMSHHSQHVDPAALERRVREAFGAAAQRHGMAEGRQAEEFFVVATG